MEGIWHVINFQQIVAIFIMCRYTFSGWNAWWVYISCNFPFQENPCHVGGIRSFAAVLQGCAALKQGGGDDIFQGKATKTPEALQKGDRWRFTLFFLLG